MISSATSSITRRVDLPKVSFCLLCLSAIIDPIGKFYNLRWIAVSIASLMVITNRHKIIQNLQKAGRAYLPILYISILTPLYGILIAWLRGGFTNSFQDTANISAGLLLFLSLPLTTESQTEKVTNFFIVCLRILSIMIFTAYLLVDIDIVRNFFIEYNIAVISTRNFFGIEMPYIYFLASPLLAYLSFYDLDRLLKSRSFLNIIFLITGLISFFLTGTRSHLFLSSFLFLYFLTVSFLKRNYKITLLILLPITWFIYTHPNAFSTDMILEFLSPEETNNSMKIEVLTFYKNVFSDPVTFLFGQGFNAHTWHKPLLGIIAVQATRTELTYLEIVRVYGILIAVGFLLILFFVISNFKKINSYVDYRWLLGGLYIHLVDAFSQPYIFSINGMLPLGIIIAHIRNGRKDIVKDA